ncbi:MAG: hypothetical protein ACI8YQ_001035 [Polaribacter sp.]|jgi:hypothetical protein
MSNHKIVLIGVDNGIETIESTTEDIVAGDVYVINGQSNVVAAASIHPTDLSTYIRSYTNAQALRIPLKCKQANIYHKHDRIKYNEDGGGNSPEFIVRFQILES